MKFGQVEDPSLIDFTLPKDDAKTKEILETLSQLIKSGLIVRKEVLTFDEAATFTGLSKSYLYKLTSGQKIPFYKPAGKLCYFNRLELESWLQRSKIEVVDNI